MDVSRMATVLLSLLMHCNLALSQSTCDVHVYGKPAAKDCFDLYNQLPGENLSPGINPDEPRSFVEPKFLDPPFTPVVNPYDSQMVQLPKIWRTGTCRAALMSVADAAGFVHEPTSVDTWRTVLNAVIDNVQDCVLESSGAGGMRFANMDDQAAKVLYIYAIGSPFENILNRYMSGYNLGVDPDDPVAFLKGALPVNGTANTVRARSSSFSGVRRIQGRNARPRQHVGMDRPKIRDRMLLRP